MSNKIFDFLYLGSAMDARDEKHLKERKVGHIMICAKQCEPRFPKKLKYIKFGLRDVNLENISQHFDASFEYLEQVRKSFEETQQSCLVHCLKGISRSATIVIAYCMRAEKMTLNEAYKFVFSKRQMICPNRGFLKQLYEYEKQLFGENQIKMDKFDDMHRDWVWNTKNAQKRRITKY